MMILFIIFIPVMLATPFGVSADNCTDYGTASCSTKEKCDQTAKENPNATITKKPTDDCKGGEICCILVSESGGMTCSVKLDGKDVNGKCKNSCDIGESGTASGKGGCIKPLRCCYTQTTAGGTTCSSMGNGECILEKACNEKVKKNSRQSKASTDDCKAADGKVCCYLLPEVQAAAGAGSPTELTNPLGANATFYTVIQRVISAFLGMVGALALAVFVYAGVMWMTAGSSDRVQKAKDAMKYAIIGLAMIAFSYAITTFFIDTLTGRLSGQSGAATVQYATPPPPNE